MDGNNKNEDFEITQRIRRSTALKEQTEQKAAADATAAQTVSGAQATARQLIADATHEVRRLHAQRNATHAHLEDLHGRLRAALDESLAATPAEPDLPRGDSLALLDEDRPKPGPGLDLPTPAPAPDDTPHQE